MCGDLYIYQKPVDRRNITALLVKYVYNYANYST